MSNRKALCVGINQFKNFPGSTLQGCVNDAHAMGSVLTKLFGFTSEDVTTLVDAQATKANIMTQLRAMVDGAKAGKYSHLVFSLSSHGTQVPDKNGDEADHFDEAFCPHDLAAKNGQWDLQHLIVDDELQTLFAQLPATVLLEVYLDTCHSGTGLRAIDLAPDRRPRYLAPPSRQACEHTTALMPRGLRRRMAERGASHSILFAACRDNQTSADAYIGGSYHGAFTYFWCKEILAANNKLSRTELLKRVNADLANGHYSQVAQLEADATQRVLSPGPRETQPSQTTGRLRLAAGVRGLSSLAGGSRTPEGGPQKGRSPAAASGARRSRGRRATGAQRSPVAR